MIVNKEVAILLVKAGYEKSCVKIYLDNSGVKDLELVSAGYMQAIPAPEMWDVLQWLRVEKKLFVIVTPFYDVNNNVFVYKGRFKDLKEGYETTMFCKPVTDYEITLNKIVMMALGNLVVNHPPPCH
jgi:hypothetical protein